MELTQIIRRPVVTEKGVKGNVLGKYVFLVHPDSTKIEVKKAMEYLYGIKVKTVQMLSVRKKVRMIGRDKSVTKRRASKKTMITLLNPKVAFDILKVKLEK